MNRILSMMLVLIIMLTSCGSDEKESDKGPFTVGIIAPYAPLDDVTAGFQNALAGYEYIEGENLTYAYTRARNGDIDSVLSANPDIIFCITTPACELVQKAEVTAEAVAGIPVVFVTEIDPTIIGFVEEWPHPGGKYTGISIFPRTSSSEGRRLELLMAIDPTIKKVWIPYDSTEISASIKRDVVQNAADALGITLVYRAFESDTELNQVVEDMPDDIDAIFTFSEKVYGVESAIVLPNVAIMHRLPYSGVTVEYGALMSYGPDWYAVGEQSARLVNRILSGTSPGDLPVETPDFVLSINLKTAQYIGLEVPDSVLRQAHLIIRE